MSPRSEFTLVLEANPSNDLESCAIRAQAIANDLQVAVRFDFNGTLCYAVPGGSSQAIVEVYDAEVAAKRNPRAW